MSVSIFPGGVDYFQCLLCRTCFPTLWNVEKHIKNHEESIGRASQLRRRGMLPIQKLTLPNCYVPVVKNQIDPSFLEQYEQVLPLEEDIEETGPGDFSKSDLLSNAKNDQNHVVSISEETPSEPAGPRRSIRKSRIKAGENIRRAAAILRIPENADEPPEGEDEDYDFVRNTITSSDDDDDGGGPAEDGKPRKAGRPKGKRTPRHDTDKVLSCPVRACGKPHTSYFALRSHLNLHAKAESKETEEAPSSTCDNDQTPGDGRRESKCRNSEREPFSCKFCLKACNSRNELKSHLEERHQVLEVELKCVYCSKSHLESGNTVTEYLSHLLTFHAEELDRFDERYRRNELLLKRKIEQNLVKCDFDQCGKSFNTKYELSRHKYLVHGDDPRRKKQLGPEDQAKKFRCPVCQRGFDYKDNLRRHFTLHLESNPFVCDFPSCGRRFNGLYNLRRHKRMHNENDVNNDSVKCPLCPKILSRKDKLKRHLQNSHKPSDVANPQKKTRMLFCARESRLTSYEILKKLQNSTVNLSRSAEDSVNSLTSRIQEEMSRKKEDSIPNIKTEVKTEGSLLSGVLEEVHFTDKIILDSDGNAVHLKGETLVPEESRPLIPIPCSTTSTVSSETSAKDENPCAAPVTQFLNSEPRVRELCKKDVAIAEQLITRKHSYHPSVRKSFKCSKCPDVFTRAWTLQLHMSSVHKKTILDEIVKPPEEGGNEILLLCGNCAYPAKDADDLKTHMKKAHSNKCPKCGRLFSDKTRMEAHMRRMHNSEEKFICDICSKSYFSASALNGHISRIHNGKKKKRQGKKEKQNSTERPYCRLCGDSFSSETSLQRHIQGIHLQKPINKRSRKNGLPGETGSAVKRGPKTTKSEDWIDSLMERIENPSLAKSRPLQSVPCENESVSGGNKDTNQDLVRETEGEDASILGF